MRSLTPRILIHLEIQVSNFLYLPKINEVCYNRQWLIYLRKYKCNDFFTFLTLVLNVEYLQRTALCWPLCLVSSVANWYKWLIATKYRRRQSVSKHLLENFKRNEYTERASGLTLFTYNHTSSISLNYPTNQFTKDSVIYIMLITKKKHTLSVRALSYTWSRAKLWWT